MDRTRVGPRAAVGQAKGGRGGLCIRELGFQFGAHRAGTGLVIEPVAPATAFLRLGGTPVADLLPSMAGSEWPRNV